MRTLLASLLSLLVASAALAQAEPPDAPPRPADDGGAPKVYFAHSYFKDHYYRAGLDDLVSLHIQNFNTLMQQVDGNCTAIVLFINGMAIKGLKPESCDSVNGHIRYRMERTADSDAAWHELLGHPMGFTRPVSLSVGKDAQFSVGSSVSEFELEVIPRVPFYMYILLLVAALLVMIYLCKHTSLVRNNVPGVAQEQRPFSLALSQMAFWFFLVVAAYVFIWMINDELDTITESVLGLIGIGSATAIGAVMIDQNKKSLDAATTTTRGFIRDVTSDDTGNVSLHRFQMLVWTLVLGVIFIVSVYNNLEMPEFSSTLLGLMGISSGTYLGFKVPENAASVTTATTTATPPATTTTATPPATTTS